VNPTVETLIIPILPSGLRMRPSTDWRGTWKGRLLRAWAFGPSRLALVIGILFVLLSLVLPFWTLAERTSSTLEIHSFSWRTFVTERFEDGTWSETTIFPYTSGGFPYPTVAGVAGNVYILSVVYLAILVIMLALFQMGFSRTLPTLSLLFISLIVLTGALFALFYPLVAIPTAATTDARYFAIGGPRMVAAPDRCGLGHRRGRPALPEESSIDGPHGTGHRPEIALKPRDSDGIFK
jgi:hypothetical protein